MLMNVNLENKEKAIALQERHYKREKCRILRLNFVSGLLNKFYVKWHQERIMGGTMGDQSEIPRMFRGITFRKENYQLPAKSPSPLR